MNLFINSPSHYTQEYGVIDEIYNMCSYISQNIDINDYTESIDTIGIVPMIAPIDVLNQVDWKEQKYVSRTYRMASISLISDYHSYCNGNVIEKKGIILDNIFRSLQEVKKQLKREFDYAQIERDIKVLVEDFDNMIPT